MVVLVIQGRPLATGTIVTAVISILLVLVPWSIWFYWHPVIVQAIIQIPSNINEDMSPPLSSVSQQQHRVVPFGLISSFQCKGSPEPSEPGYPGYWTSCAFSNVCWQDSTLYFYADGTEFHPKFLRWSYWDNRPLNIRIVPDAPVPWNTSVVEPALVSLAFESFIPGGPGHFLVENALPVYLLFRMFGFEKENDSRLYLWQKPGEYLGSFLNDEHGWMRGLTQKPLGYLRTGEHICFRNLLMGHATMLGLRPHGMPQVGRGMGVSDFIQQYSTRLSVPREQLPICHHILWSMPRCCERRVVNASGIAERLRSLGYPIRLVYLPALNSSEQLRLIAQSTMFITPGNTGGALMSLFLPPGAAALYIACWDFTRSISLVIDRFVWGHYPGLQEHYYDVTAADVRIQGDKWGGIYEDNTDVTLDFERFHGIIHNAMESVNRWSVQRGLPVPAWDKQMAMEHDILEE